MSPENVPPSMQLCSCLWFSLLDVALLGVALLDVALLDVALLTIPRSKHSNR